MGRGEGVLSRRDFPSDFVWGASTAAYQVEGAVTEDGRGESIWDRFSHLPGKVRHDENGDIACDHYHRYREDISLLRDLGVSGYRFSIAWARVLPEGRGRVNPKGLDFYDSVVDTLLESGIEPYVTLYHWDLPQALEDRGGWPQRDIVDAFAEYTETVVRRLGDRVRHWITHNEPWVQAWGGYGFGNLAPGRTGDATAYAAAHHLLLSHGRAVGVIRRDAPNSEVGIALNLVPVEPASNSTEDVEAARIFDGTLNRWWLDAIHRKAYPDDIWSGLGDEAPRLEADDMEHIAAPIDFLGVNYYLRMIVRQDPETGRPVGTRPPSGQFTDMDWEVYPEGLYTLLTQIQRDYGPARLYITENGAAFPDVYGHDGRVHDPERQQYIEEHLRSCSRAIADGVALAGYFCWSLLDNFEWSLGYAKRFGLIYVDYHTLERVPKTSYAWYRSFIAE
jgi:beta-glucosidase